MFSPTKVKRFLIESLSLITGRCIRYVFRHSLHSLPFSPHLHTLGMYRTGPSQATCLSQLHTAGARNFLFLNVPPIHRAPHQPRNSSLAKSIPSWNVRLANLATSFGSTYSGTSVFLFDTYSLFNRILDAPGDFEHTRHLSNLKDQCDAYVEKVTSQEMYERECGVPYDQYFWHDGLHVTFPVHRVVAEEVAAFLGGW